MDEVRYGPVRIRISGDEVRGRSYLPRAMQMLRRAQERQRLGQLNVLRDHQSLDDDSYCYVVLGGGMATLHIIAGHAEADGDADVEINATPDFVSGVIAGGTIRAGEGGVELLHEFHPTQACIENYRPKEGRRHPFPFTGSFQPLQRLAVKPADEFAAELGSGSSAGGRENSQYVKLKPTMFTGAMRGLVQALMGFGKQRRKGNRQISLYERFGVADEPSAAPARPSAFASDTAKKGLQIRYDWKWARSHGLVAAADGRRWIIEIGINGVLAMPLPLHEATTTAEFAERVEEAGDVDAQKLLELYGGFPSGEPFPTGLDAWVRAGRVLRLLTREQMRPFYDHIGYSTVMGWAFNLSGTEAHNTAYRYADDGYQRGVHYCVSVGVGPTRVLKPSPLGQAYRQKLLPLRGNRDYPAIEAVLWKCDRLTASDVAGLQWSAGSIPALYRAIDALELPPMATGNAHLSRVSEGVLYHPGKTGNLIKFPEPAIGLLVSHDMRRERHAVGDPRCDTTVHVFFAGDELKWVRYFREPRSGGESLDDDYEQCMYVGSWHQHEETGGKSIPTAFYTSDFDDRIETSPSVSDTTVIGTDEGYAHVFLNDCLPWPIHATMGRSKRFKRVTTTKRVTDGWMQTGIAVPFHDREAYYYALQTTDGGGSDSRSVGYFQLEDPWSYRTWRVLGGWNNSKTPHPDGCGIGMTTRTVMNPGHTHGYCIDFEPNQINGAGVYKPTTCSDYADTGPWAGLCDNAESMLYYVAPPESESSFETSKPAGRYVVWLVNSSDHGQIKAAQVESLYFGLWPLISPDNGNPDQSADQYLEVTGNALGTANAMRYTVNINEKSRLIGRPDWSGMESGALTFVGVVNG
ncbi:TPA: hypothetical protein ACOEQZ_001312 [Stenotrophomonas maltophilia]